MKATEQEILEWKAKYGEDALREITIKGEDDKELVYIVRVPGRSDLELVAYHGQKNDLTKANDALLKNCVLHGDKDAIEKDGGVMAALLTQISGLVKARQSEIKKL